MLVGGDWHAETGRAAMNTAVLEPEAIVRVHEMEKEESATSELFFK